MPKRRPLGGLAVDACFTAALVAMAVLIPLATHAPVGEVVPLWLTGVAAGAATFRLSRTSGLVVFMCFFFGGTVVVALAGGNVAAWPIAWAATCFGAQGVLRLFSAGRSKRPRRSKPQPG